MTCRCCYHKAAAPALSPSVALGLFSFSYPFSPQTSLLLSLVRAACLCPGWGRVFLLFSTWAELMFSDSPAAEVMFSDSPASRSSISFSISFHSFQSIHLCSCQCPSPLPLSLSSLVVSCLSPSTRSFLSCYSFTLYRFSLIIHLNTHLDP